MKVEKPIIYLITDNSLTAQNYSDKIVKLTNLISIAVDCGVSMIQLREKKISARQLYQLTLKAVEIRGKNETKILVNDRFDVAQAAQSDGVHLTTHSIKSEFIRRHTPKKFLIGVSTHSIKEMLEAQRGGSSFCVYSPIFETPQKETPKGLEDLKLAVEAAQDFPVLALGGINETNFSETLNAGASGIAAIRLFNNPETLPEIVKKINEFYRK